MSEDIDKWNDEFLDLPTLRLACRLRTASRRRGIEPRDRQTHQRRLPHAFHRAKGEARRNSTVPKDEKWCSGSGLVLSARGNAEGIYRYADVGPSVPHFVERAAPSNEYFEGQFASSSEKAPTRNGWLQHFPALSDDAPRKVRLPGSVETLLVRSGSATGVGAIRETPKGSAVQWAERMRLGFDLPGSSLNGQLGQLIPFRKAG